LVQYSLSVSFVLNGCDWQCIRQPVWHIHLLLLFSSWLSLP
jgi:hypothetical protein